MHNVRLSGFKKTLAILRSRNVFFKKTKKFIIIIIKHVEEPETNPKLIVNSMIY